MNNNSMDESKYKVEGRYNLVILNTRLEDCGRYFCNETGVRINYDAEVVILGKTMLLSY